MRERAYDRLPGVKMSSLYDVVRRLVGAGLMVAAPPSRVGNRPERTAMEITSAGRDELVAWIESALADDKDPDGLPAALSFMYSLPESRVIQILRGRAERMSSAIDATELELERSFSGNQLFASEHRYQLARRRAERDWVVDFVRDLERGTISWPQQTSSDPQGSGGA